MLMDKKCPRFRHRRSETGEVMLEGMIIVTLTIFLLVWLLGLGFLYYQRYVTTIVTNDAAVKIASTYNNPSSDIIMGYVTTEDLSQRDLYRNFSSGKNSGSLHSTNQDRAAAYVKYILNKANFAGTVAEVKVELEVVTDSLVRKHIKLTTTCTYNTPFGAVLDMFGFGSQSTYRAVACADCTDIADYISTVQFAATASTGEFLEGDKFTSSILKMLNKFVEYYNYKYS